ncbi:hypothetical protein NC651_014178 [Populus alba x Populus x berolinensis]|nr:hypothetical protein NC651_014178 [Populus alba x Populus x berolinensis]
MLSLRWINSAVLAAGLIRNEAVRLESPISDMVQQVLPRHWTIRVRRVFQKSPYNHDVSLGTHHFKSPMKSLSALLYADMIGVTIPLITRLRDPVVIMN